MTTDRANDFALGQCYISVTEPELGLGFISEIERRTISVFFPGSDEERTYGATSIPLERVSFDVGETIKTQSGDELLVELVEVEDGLFFYCGDGQIVPETQLSITNIPTSPVTKLLSGLAEDLKSFELRQEAQAHHERILTSSVRGFLGPRVSLLPHQIFVATEIAKRAYPRVLLADEVGLGKTIEAGLILHHLLLTQKIERVLLVVPRSLTHQWFIEMYRRFHLPFNVLNKEADFLEDTLPLEDAQLHIISIEMLTRFDEARKQALNSNWDMIAIDEAHRLKWSQSESSDEFDTVQALASKSPGLLLLTATPEQLGFEGHFARLHLLDPNRFPSIDKYKKESQLYRRIVTLADSILAFDELNTTEIENLESELANFLDDVTFDLKSTQERQAALKKLVDRFGTGRVLFRNTRDSLSDHGFSQANRTILPYTLDASVKNVEMFWLKDLLEKNPKKKYLLICKTKEKTEEIHKFLKKHTKVDAGFFHSDLDLIDRDRNAILFAEKGGMQILLCSEIGSEGRNFQFVHDLILFDLPDNPDLLEQRIGRLDRIGQKDEISIHVPIIEDSEEEIWYEWYHRGLNAFEKTLKGARQLHRDLKEDLDETLKLAGNQDGKKSRIALIEKTKKRVAELNDSLAKGRDRLIELNSFQATAAVNQVKLVKNHVDPKSCEAFIFRACEILGIEINKTSPHTAYMEPSELRKSRDILHLPADGMAVTFQRDVALENSNVNFLSWDHPLVLSFMDMFVSGDYGNSAVVSFKEEMNSEPLMFELLFLLNFVAPKALDAESFFPPHTFRIVLDREGNDVTNEWSKERLAAVTQDAKRRAKENIHRIPKTFMESVVDVSKRVLHDTALAYQKECEAKMVEKIDEEIDRLQALKLENNLVRQSEIDYFEAKKKRLLDVARKSELKLDSLKIILPWA